MRRLSRAVAAALLTAVVSGCVAKPEIRPPYTGPTEPIAAVVEKINARNARVDKLRGEATFRTKLVDPQTKRTRSISGDMRLLYMPRRNLRLVGEVTTKVVFDIGSNDDRFWMMLPSDGDSYTMWWGSHRLIGGEKMRQLPVRPDLLADVLSVGTIDTDLLKEPVPVMRFNNDQRAYMFTWHVQLPDRWIVQKEVWYDLDTLQPKLVLLFDADGRVVLRAHLQKPIAASGFESPVDVPSVYDMYFPDTGSTFRLEFFEWKRQNRGAPTPRSFNFPGENPNVTNVVPLDD